MNERIKELIKQAADQTSAAFSSSNFRQSEWESDFREKFAELIIHECAIAMSKIPGGYSAEKYYESNKIIKQHFGVE